MSCEWTPFRKEGTPTAIDVSDKRPVSRQRIGQSPIYKHGIIKTDHQSINTWFAKAHAINEIKKKEHRALYTGKIEMRRTITSWNRPGMIFLPTIRNDIVDNFLMDNIARAEQRMMREGEKLQAQFLRQQQDKQRQERLDAQQQLAQEALGAPQQRTRVHEEPPPPKTIGLGSTVAPHKARRKSLWEAGSQEIDKRIITRGVKMSGAWFVLTVSRVSVDAREVGLRFTAEHVNAAVPTTPPLSPASPTPSPPCVSTTTTMRMSWSALTTALYDMGRESLAERCLHCVTFPSPDFEIQARAFACAAFMMRRVYVEPDPNQGGWAIVLQQPEERIEQEEGRVEQDAVFLTATTSSTHGGSSDEEAEAPLNGGGGSMLLPPQEQFGGKPYFPNSLSSLPPRAGALRTALFPDRANWHTTQSRLEMKQQDPLVYEASRPKLRQILPLPASLTSPMRKKKKKRKRHKRPKKESWVTPYGSVAYGNGNIAFAKQKSKRKFKRKQLPALAVPVVAMTIEEELNKEMRNEQRLEARRAFLNQAKDPNISDAHRTTLLNGAATIDRLRELDGYSLTGLHALPDFKFHGAVHGALHKQHHADEDDQFYFKKKSMQQEELHRDDDDDDDGSRYTEQEHSEAAVEINALCTEVAQELLSEQPTVGAQRRSMPIALMQRRLEATDALEAVARFNSKHKCIPLTPVVGKTRSAAPLVAHQGLYMPSDSDDEEEERKEEEDRKVEAERKRKERQHKKKAKREKRQQERKQREEKQAIEAIEAEKKRKQQQQQQQQQQEQPPAPPPQDKRKRSKTKKATKSNRPVSPLLPQSPPTPQKKKKRPISSPGKHSQTIECVFPAGPLGLSLGDCSTGPSSPATNDGRASPPPSPARTMTVIIDVEDHCLHGQILKMGDVIERIDQVSCNCLRFQQVLKLIRTAPRPMTVAFRRETIVQQPATSLKASPRSQTFVKQPGLISSPPMPDKYARASVPVQDMFLMEDDGSDER